MAISRKRWPTLEVDVMIDGWKYYGSISFQYNPCFHIKEEELRQAAIQRYPTLREKNFTLMW